MEQKDTILVIDDDIEIRKLLCEYLDQQGYRTLAAADGKEMWSILDKSKVDLIVLDLMLPGDDGLVLCRNLRSNSQIPVIMLTARGEETERIVGLEMGADDYLAKPFNTRELLARIKSVLRRTHSLTPSADQQSSRYFLFAGWKLDTIGRHLVSPDKVVISLSGGEYQLLHVFLTHPSRVLSRDQLLDLMHGREMQPFDRSIDVMVSRLRRSLQDKNDCKIIQTVRNEGYIFAANVEVEK
jgi:two-component system OmpR family response regulator